HSQADQEDHGDNDHCPDTQRPPDHDTRPLFTEKVATSQYSQNAAHPTAKTTRSSAARTVTHASKGEGSLAIEPLSGTGVAEPGGRAPSSARTGRTPEDHALAPPRRARRTDRRS